MAAISSLKRVIVLGSQGLIGAAVSSKLINDFEVVELNRSSLDFRETNKLVDILANLAPFAVINTAGRVAGIQGNIDSPADLILENTEVSSSIMRACHMQNIKNYIQYASACVYPLNSSEDSRVEDLGTGKIESTSQSYATAKIFAIECARAFRIQFGYNWTTLIPSNVYGPRDQESGLNGHVISMLVQKFMDATLHGRSEVQIWGDGMSTRNFLHVDDLASATSFLLKLDHQSEAVINLNGPAEISILALAEMIRNFTGFKGDLVWDESKPNGARKKNLDDSYLKSRGWNPKISLSHGLHDYVNQFNYLPAIKQV